jgi:hypothetical protein
MSFYHVKYRENIPHRQKLCYGITMALGICFIIAALSTENFIFTHGEHDCCGDGCPVCLQIQGGIHFFGHLRSAGFYIRFPFHLFLTDIVISKSIINKPASITSVMLKAKMNL